MSSRPIVLEADRRTLHHRQALRTAFPQWDLRPASWFSSRVPRAVWCGGGVDEVAGSFSESEGTRSGQSEVRFSPGFLRGYLECLNEPIMSFCASAHREFDISHQTGALSLHERIDGTDLDHDEEVRAQAAMSSIRDAQLSPYCAVPPAECHRKAVFGISQTFVLLIDETVERGRAVTHTPFDDMLASALAEWPDHQLVVLCNSATDPMRPSAGPLERLARGRKDVLLLDRPCNVWQLLTDATEVMVVNSLIGFLALLAGSPVSCFGKPFYARRGLTDDRAHTANSLDARSLTQVFTAAYIDHCRYIDPHDGKSISLEQAIDTLATIARSRARSGRGIVTVGLSPWKRRAVAPFLVSCTGPAIHVRNDAKAKRLSMEDGVSMAVWGADPYPNDLQDKGENRASDKRIVRMEDAFLRSIGLGASLRFPCSLVAERNGRLHFDARGVSGLETLIASRSLTASEIVRVRQLRQTIVAERATKYMLSGSTPTLPTTGRTRILVPGQVEDDASLRYGAGNVATNDALLARVRTRHPDAFIAYRAHPDVAAGLRPGRIDPLAADADVSDCALPDLLDWCDRVETMTSLTGFEALLRGVPVATHGWPFYAGWGLTDDGEDREPRGRADLDTLVHAALIDYPVYIHPRSRMPCTVERTLGALSADRHRQSPGRWNTDRAVTLLVRILRGFRATRR